jgi:hypothetical protein
VQKEILALQRSGTEPVVTHLVGPKDADGAAG